MSGVIPRAWALNFMAAILNQCCLGWIVTLLDIVFKLASTLVVRN